MRNLSIKYLHGRGRVHDWSWCWVMAAVLVFAVAPITASAASSAPAADAQSGAPQPVVPQPVVRQPVVPQPEAGQREAGPPVVPQPEAGQREAGQPEAARPAADQEPPSGQEEGGVRGAFLGPTAKERAKGHVLRKTGLGIMATGGVVGTAGFGLTLVFTVIGDARQDADEPVLEDIEQQDGMAQVGGILLASGIAVVAIGGIIFASGKKKSNPQPTARVRVMPAIGGVVFSGRF